MTKTKGSGEHVLREGLWTASREQDREDAHTMEKVKSKQENLPYVWGGTSGGSEIMWILMVICRKKKKSEG